MKEDEGKHSNRTPDKHKNTQKKAEGEMCIYAKVIGTGNEHISCSFISIHSVKLLHFFFLHNKHFVNVSFVSVQRGKKNITAQELFKNSLFPKFLPASSLAVHLSPPHSPLTSSHGGSTGPLSVSCFQKFLEASSSLPHSTADQGQHPPCIRKHPHNC